MSQVKKTSTLLLFLGFINLYAQDHIDLVNLYWRLSPANAIEGVDNDKFNFHMFTADVKLPLVINDKNTIIIGSEYQQSRFISENLGFTVNSLNLQIGFQRKWNDKFKSLFMFIPKIALADFSTVNSTSFQFAGLMISSKNRTDNFAWKYGAYYNSEFFGPMIVPLFGFDWKINNDQRLKIIVPLDIEYAINPGAKNKIRFGLRFIGANASYRIQNNQYLDKADNNFWLFNEIYLTKNLVFHMKAGHSALRKYRIYENDRRMGLKLGPININDDRPDTIPLFKGGWSFELRLLFRLGLTAQK